MQVYNPPNRGIPYWVTEAQYADPQDGTAAQFIAWGLKPHTTYSFRVRSYSGNTSPVFGAYSNTASGTTCGLRAAIRFPAGKDTNDGKGRRQRARLAYPGTRGGRHRLRTGADRDGRQLCHRRDSHGAEVLRRGQGRGAGQSRRHGHHRLAAGKLRPRPVAGGRLPGDRRPRRWLLRARRTANTMPRSTAATTHCSMWNSTRR